MGRVLPAVTCVAMLAALYLVFMVVPTEQQMGIVQRIFYFHVSSAWMAFIGFFLVRGRAPSTSGTARGPPIGWPRRRPRWACSSARSFC